MNNNITIVIVITAAAFIAACMIGGTCIIVPQATSDPASQPTWYGELANLGIIADPNNVWRLDQCNIWPLPSGAFLIQTKGDGKHLAVAGSIKLASGLEYLRKEGYAGITILPAKDLPPDAVIVWTEKIK